MVEILQLAGAFVVGLVAGTGIFIIGFFAGRSERDGTTIFRTRAKPEDMGEALPGEEDFHEEWTGGNRLGEEPVTPFPSDDDLAKINEYNDLETRARELRGIYE